MADTAAHLVDRVLPRVSVRQWVLSLPFALRYRLAYDSNLVTQVLGVFVRAVFGSLQRRARDQDGIAQSQCGAVTFIQRSGGSLNLNIHFHMVALDGVYASDDNGRPQFHPLLAPEDADVAAVATDLAHRIPALIERRGLGPQSDPEQADSLAQDQPLLADLYSASVLGRIATGPNAGQRIQTRGDRIDGDDAGILTGPRCASVSGFSLHANERLRMQAR